VVSYSGLKFAMDVGIDVWDFSETLTLAAVIRDHGTPDQKLRLQQEIIGGRWASAIFLAERDAAQ
jgi:alkylation response protein AidB-like acyl-CoA dehydrogenase